jgi:hypothetical protein
LVELPEFGWEGGARKRSENIFLLPLAGSSISTRRDTRSFRLDVNVQGGQNFRHLTSGLGLVNAQEGQKCNGPIYFNVLKKTIWPSWYQSLFLAN